MECDKCNTIFTRKDNLLRHQNKYCSKREEQESDVMSETHDENESGSEQTEEESDIEENEEELVPSSSFEDDSQIWEQMKKEAYEMVCDQIENIEDKIRSDNPDITDNEVTDLVQKKIKPEIVNALMSLYKEKITFFNSLKQTSIHRKIVKTEKWLKRCMEEIDDDDDDDESEEDDDDFLDQAVQMRKSLFEKIVTFKRC